MSRRSVWVWAAAAVLLAGCTRLNHSETVSVPAKRANAVFALPVPTSDEKITVTAEAADREIAVYLVPTAKANEAVDAIEAGRTDDKLIPAKSEKGAKVTLETTIHANDDFNLVVANFSKESADVKVTVTGK